MKKIKYILFILLLFANAFAFAGSRHRDRGKPRTEVGLMNNVLGCLANKDSISYFDLFPPFDSLWALVIYNKDRSPEAVRELDNMKAHPQLLLQFDPYYNYHIVESFNNVLKKGEDSGIHWNSIVMQRYELEKEVINHRDLIGYDRIVPERFKGYMFVRDLLGRLTFCITIREIQKINGYFFGGRVDNILEASTIDEYIKKEAAEEQYFEWLANHPKTDTAATDSVKKADSALAAKDKKKADYLNASASDDDSFKARREVVDRRYYEGKFDEEISVQLFVRYMKDLRTGAVTGYDGLYKFGDQLNYVKLHITKGLDGKWNMEDDIPLGSMDLELKAKVYTGSWTNTENQTGYDVVLTQTTAPEKKIEQLDRMLETGKFGRVDDEVIERKRASNNDEVEGVNPPDEEVKKTGSQSADKEEKPKRVKKPRHKYADDE